MVKVLGIGALCIASFASAHAETFVLEADKAGHEATVKIPAGAVTHLSADFCESLINDTDPQVESMRLRGDVLISIAGSEQPIQIKADKVVLELTPDFAPGQIKHNRADAAANKVIRSANSTATDSDMTTQTFVGNVVFDLQTPAGPMEIKADRVEHRLQTDGGVEAGA